MATPGYKIVGPDGRESAPFDSDALVSYARMGYVQPSTTVFDPTIGQWIPATQVNALAALNAGLPPQSRPPVPQPQPAVQTPYGTSMSAPPSGAGIPRALAAVIGVGIGVVVAFIAYGVKQVSTKLESKQRIATIDSRYTVTIPAYWHRYTTKDPSLIEYMGAGNGVVLTRITEFPSTGRDLVDVTDQVAANAQRNLHVNTLYSQPVDTTVAGYPARQFQVDDDGHIGPHRFRNTLIATPDGIYEVVLLTRTADVDRDRALQDGILASFHTNTPANARSAQ